MNIPVYLSETRLYGQLTVKGGGSGQSITVGYIQLYDAGLWLAIPPVTGCVPPSSNYFSFTIMDDHQVILFGGFNGSEKFDDVYILDLTTWVRIF